MFTLQILDRGQTFLHTIDRPVLLGSGAGADVVLREEGVQPAHARIEPSADGVRLVALAETRVNGAPVQQADLSLGDRIQIGASVLVVGRTVARAARPEDVLADPLPRTPRRSATTAKKKSPLPLIGVAAVALGLVGWLAFGSSDATRVAGELAQIRRSRADGQVDRAVAAITRLEREWAGATDDRLDKLAVERAAVDAIGVTAERLTAAILDPADRRTQTEWREELQRLEHEGDEAERIAARRVRAHLADTYSKRPPAPRIEQPDAPRLAATPAPAPASTPPPVASTPPPRVAEQFAQPPAIDWNEVDRLCSQGLFAQAIGFLQAAMDTADEAGVKQLNARSDDVRKQASASMAKLLDAAAESVRAGKPQDALKQLQSERHRFPATAEFAAIGEHAARAEALVAAAARPAPVAPAPVDNAARVATLAAVRAQMDAVRGAEEQGAFADAARRLREAAAAVRDRDADFAGRLIVRAEEAELIAAWHDAVAAALRGGKKVAITSTADARVEVTGVDGGALVGSGSERLTWLDVAPAGVQQMAEQLAITGRPLLGAAALMYKHGDSGRAETVLAKVVRADAALKGAVDSVVARGRGETIGEGGYNLGKDGFASARSVELQKDAQKLAARVATALRDKNPAAREALIAEAKAGGPESLQVLVTALQKELDTSCSKLAGSPLKKQLDRLDAQRVRLDEARQHAKDLIYDEKKYFYPYKPPAVSSDQAAEYTRVQAEVDRRVAAVRVLWNDEGVRVRVPAGLRVDLDRLDWLADQLLALGSLPPAALADLGWARALPAGDSVGVRDYCRTADERAERQEWSRVETYNTIIGKAITSSQREQIRITNEYRLMFGHRPLAAVEEICAAAQGHAAEMSRLGYFAHTSPTPGRKTPYDRMRLAGYEFGASENIALCDGALGAHNAWCTSSSHHRNLLEPSHREMGVGADGRYWVQNFGSGTLHRDRPAWSATATPKR